MRKALAIVALLGMVILGSAFTKVGEPPSVSAYFDADSSRYLGESMIVWGSKNAASVTYWLKFGQAVEYDTTQTSPNAWVIPFDATLTDVWAECAGAGGGEAPNDTIQVWTAHGTPVLLWEAMWRNADVFGADSSIAGFQALSVDVDAGTGVAIILKPSAALPADPDYPEIQLVFRERTN